MADDGFEITTERLLLRPWRSGDEKDFSRMNADVEVMADLGGPLTRSASDEKMRRFRRAFELHGITRWVVTDLSDQFLGYCGIVPQTKEHPIGAHHEIGWRLKRTAWGHGYATEAASAALTDAFDRLACREVLAYTSADNTRSQAVMTRLGLQRRPSLDFTHHYGFGPWGGLVWAATPGRCRDPRA